MASRPAKADRPPPAEEAAALCAAARASRAPRAARPGGTTAPRRRERTRPEGRAPPWIAASLAVLLVSASPPPALATGSDAIILSVRGCPEKDGPATRRCATSGGTQLHVNGLGFGAQARVSVGTKPCSGVRFIGASAPGGNDTLTCRLPPGVGAGLDVTVSQSGERVTLEAGLSYAGPSITGISGCDGTGHTYECPSAGGATIVIKGEDFGLDGASVTVGGRECASVRYRQAYREIACTLPPGTGLDVPVIVSHRPPNGEAMHGTCVAQAELTEEQEHAREQWIRSGGARYGGCGLSYATPVVERVSGCNASDADAAVTVLCPRGGGVLLAVEGRNFGDEGATVHVGGRACKGVAHDVESPHSLLYCRLPAGRGGSSARVLVTTAGGLTGSLEEAVGYADGALRPELNASRLGIGGLAGPMQEIMRRVLASRLLPRNIREGFALGHVKGLLLYGPPGTGKTLLSRQLAKFMGTRHTTFVSGPELINRSPGESEARIRQLFAAAEEDAEQNGDDAELHVLVFDEVDSMFKARGLMGNDAAALPYEGAVATLLAKMDGLEAQSNVLVVGTTNRRELIDPALLRSGRFDVQIEVAPPDLEGRREILAVHTDRLGGAGLLASDVDLDALAAQTAGFTGADLAATVKAASARAFERYAAVAESVWIGVMPEADGGQAADGDEDGATHSLAHITMSDLRSAVRDVAGDHVMSIDYVAAQALPQSARAPFEAQLDEASRLVAMLAEADGQALTLSVSVEGAAGSGAMQVASAALLEHAGAFSRVGLLPASQLTGLTSDQAAAALAEGLGGARRGGAAGAVLIESVETYVRAGLGGVLAAAIQAANRPEPGAGRLLIVGTSDQVGLLEGAFDARVVMPSLCAAEHIAVVAASAANTTTKEAKAAGQAASKALQGCAASARTRGGAGVGIGESGPSGAGLRHVQKAAKLVSVRDSARFAEVLSLLATSAADSGGDLLPQRWGAGRTWSTGEL